MDMAVVIISKCVPAVLGPSDEDLLEESHVDDGHGGGYYL